MVTAGWWLFQTTEDGIFASVPLMKIITEDAELTVDEFKDAL
jgi:hypothetical protein